MKQKLTAFLCPLIFLAGFASTARAQTFSIPSYSIDGGGGTSTGGSFALHGSIGQPDAGPMNGGAYTLQGGFWGVLLVVQQPGAPRLSIEVSGVNEVSVSWSPTAEGYVLQQTDRLSPAAWTDVPIGSENPAALPMTPGIRYFRLQKP